MLKSFRNMCNMPAYQGQNIMEVDNSRYSVVNLGILKLIFVLIVTDYGRCAESSPEEYQLRLP